MRLPPLTVTFGNLYFSCLLLSHSSSQEHNHGAGAGGVWFAGSVLFRTEAVLRFYATCEVAQWQNQQGFHVKR